jgi:hypothetical protein
MQERELSGLYVIDKGPDLPSKRPLTIGDYKVLGLASLGGALEFYDFIIYVFFTQVLGHLFFPLRIPTKSPRDSDLMAPIIPR